jgi:hypothetical protein
LSAWICRGQYNGTRRTGTEKVKICVFKKLQRLAVVVEPTPLLDFHSIARPAVGHVQHLAAVHIHLQAAELAAILSSVIK